MYHIYRCILDTTEDVIRDIKIDANQSLEDLHQAIVNAFGFSTNEMASFYQTDANWAQGDEIPLIDMSDAGVSNEMNDYKLADHFKETTDKLLYVYDFLNLWTFFIELHQIVKKTGTTETQLVFTTGELPHEPPTKKFKSEIVLDSFEEEYANDFDMEFGDEFEGDINVEDLEDY